MAGTGIPRVGRHARAWTADRRARALMDKMRDVGSKGPAVAAMSGVDVKLPGSGVPADADSAQGLREFLLVPYFGACIHEPPPPADQAVLCRAAESLAGLRAMDAVWAYGRLELERTNLSVGASVYSLKLARVQRQSA